MCFYALYRLINVKATHFRTFHLTSSSAILLYTRFYKQQFYKQLQAEIDKKSSKW